MSEDSTDATPHTHKAQILVMITNLIMSQV